jgi:NHL repeat/6-bladed beta-propeller
VPKTTRAFFGPLPALAVLCVLGAIPASAVATPPKATTEAATGVSYEEATLKGTVNPEGSATTYWFEYGKTTSYGTKIPILPESVGSGTSNVAVRQTVTGLSKSTEYHFKVVAENESAETAKGEDATFTTPGFNFSFGKAGTGEGQFKQPNLGIATDSEGNIWVADTENNRVEKFNSKGEYLSQFGKEGTGNGEFKSPKGLALDPSGNIWVVDSGNNRVQKFNSKGEYLGQFGKEGTGEGQFISPAGITFSGTNFFVVDSGNNRVQKFNSSFKLLAQFGKEGSGDGEFKSPTGVLVDAAGRLWVVDTGNDRVQRFNLTTLKYAAKVGEKGSGKGQFESPTGIASDFQERLWVVDSGNGRLEKFNHEGEYQDQVGEKGTGPGQLSNPTGITTPAAQKLLILDTGNNLVEGWTVQAEPPKVIAKLASDLKAGSATLKATIDPEALATTYWFEYDTTEYKAGEAPHGTKVPITPEAIGSGSSNVQVEQIAAGLSKNTTYHFRAVAESAAGRVEGDDRTFKLVPPRAITEAATAVEATQATLNGKVDPEGSATNYWFEYGTTTAYGTKAPITLESVGSGSNLIAVKQTVTGLSKGMEYHFRVVAESEVDTTNGEDKTFTTSP